MRTAIAAPPGYGFLRLRPDDGWSEDVQPVLGFTVNTNPLGGSQPDVVTPTGASFDAAFSERLDGSLYCAILLPDGRAAASGAIYPTRDAFAKAARAEQAQSLAARVRRQGAPRG